MKLQDILLLFIVINTINCYELFPNVYLKSENNLSIGFEYKERDSICIAGFSNYLITTNSVRPVSYKVEVFSDEKCMIFMNDGYKKGKYLYMDDNYVKATHVYSLIHCSYSNITNTITFGRNDDVHVSVSSWMRSTINARGITVNYNNCDDNRWIRVDNNLPRSHFKLINKK